MCEEKVITNPVKAIRAKCIDCSDSIHEVTHCTVTRCPLYPFRFGKNPYRKPKQLTEEQKQNMLNNLAKGRAKNPL